MVCYKKLSSIIKKSTYLIILSALVFLPSKYSYVFNPVIYDNGWVELSESDLSEKMNAPVINHRTNQPFDFKMVKGEGYAKGFTNTPLEYYNNIMDGYTLDIISTVHIINRGNFIGVALPYIYYQHAKPSKYSYVRDFSLIKGDPLEILPVNFIYWPDPDQLKLIKVAKQEKQSWRKLSPNARIIEKSDNSIYLYDTFDEDFYNLPDEKKYAGTGGSHFLSLEAMGDLNKDGYEDIVVYFAYYYIGGSLRSHQYKVITKTSKDEIFRDITDEVDQLIWKGKKY